MIDNLINEGWQYHDSKPERLAQELEDSSAKVTQEQTANFLNLSNHTIGDHLGDWKRARMVAEAVTDQAPISATSARTGIFLAVARFMDGDPLGSRQAELAAIGASADTEAALYAGLDTNMLIAKALIFSKRFVEGERLYRSVIDAVSGSEQPAPLDRSFAIASNNIANELLDLPAHSILLSDLMLLCALQSLRFWKRCGTWENDERGLLLLALVANKLDQYEKAITYADQALTIISDHGGEPVDEAFVRLAAANSHLGLSSDADYVVELQKADALAASWDDDSLYAWYQEERAKVER
jgi:tetratricopeptide (TPR) repeat protein